MEANDKADLLCVYLIVGEDMLKRQAVLERLRKRLSQMGDLAFNYDEFDGETAIGPSIVQACNTLPFASEVRLVEVTHVEKLGKQDSEAIVSYLEHPCTSTILALSGDKLAKNTRLYKAIASFGKNAVITCDPMKRFELVRALRSMATSHGFALTSGAAEKLVELVGEDTVKLNSELAKVALAHEGNDPVSEREISELVSRTAEAKPWELVDAFSQRDAKRCAALLARLDSVSPYALIAQCTTRLRELACAKSLVERGEASRLAETLKVPSWRVKNHAVWASKFSKAELANAFSTARDCERAMKSGADPDAVFDKWLFETIAGSRS